MDSADPFCEVDNIAFTIATDIVVSIVRSQAEFGRDGLILI